MDFAAARVKMVDNQIRTTDVTSHETLRAFLSVPREAFVPDERRRWPTSIRTFRSATVAR